MADARDAGAEAVESPPMAAGEAADARDAGTEAVESPPVDAGGAADARDAGTEAVKSLPVAAGQAADACDAGHQWTQERREALLAGQHLPGCQNIHETARPSQMMQLLT